MTVNIDFHRKKLASGLIFLSCGLVAVVWSRDYTLGTILRM